MDATLITAHSDKEGAAPTFKGGHGHHPLWAFVDHGVSQVVATGVAPGASSGNTVDASRVPSTTTPTNAD